MSQNSKMYDRRCLVTTSILLWMTEKYLKNIKKIILFLQNTLMELCVPTYVRNGQQS